MFASYMIEQLSMAVSAGKVQNMDPWPMDPWSMDPLRGQVHGPGPSKYGPGPWTPFMDRVHGPPIFTTPKITEVNKNKIKSKVNYK